VFGIELDDRDSILRSLESEPYHVVISDSPEDAEQHLNGGAALVLMDLQSPAFDAVDVLRRWQSRQARTSFVLVTVDRDVTSVVEAMKLGAADCLLKPVDPEELRMLVAKLIDSRNGAGKDEENLRGGRRSRPNIDIPPGTSLEDLQRAAVEQALTQHHGNRTHAAKTLGISVRTLQRKLKAWGMPLAPQQTTQHHPFLLTPHDSHSSHSAFSAHAH
jgi:DNA-binding NtrC family response regulator